MWNEEKVFEIDQLVANATGKISLEVYDSERRFKSRGGTNQVRRVKTTHIFLKMSFFAIENDSKFSKYIY